MFIVTLRLAGRQIMETCPTGGAWVLGDRVWIARGIGLGVAVGLVFLGIWWIASKTFAFEGVHGPPGALSDMSTRIGVEQCTWIVLALLVAPPVEEMLLRGAVYGGFRRSFGPLWAALLTTGTFVLLHIDEVMHFPLTVSGMVGMSAAALLSRTRSSAIGPAIGAHFGYNAVIVFMVTYHF